MAQFANKDGENKMFNYTKKITHKPEKITVDLVQILAVPCCMYTVRKFSM